MMLNTKRNLGVLALCLIGIKMEQYCLESEFLEDIVDNVVAMVKVQSLPEDRIFDCHSQKNRINLSINLNLWLQRQVELGAEYLYIITGRGLHTPADKDFIALKDSMRLVKKFFYIIRCQQF